jgi:hypothetical protein
MLEAMRDLDRLPWPALADDLDRRGFALTAPVLTAVECRELVAGFDDDERYRAVVDMGRYRFGSGVYKYFAEPLPPLVGALREQLYAPLASLANAWADRLSSPRRYPPTLAAFLDECRAAGQDRPTPLVFRYTEGDYNRLHQDVYGAVTFPFQVLVPLSRPDVDFSGGEFLLVTQPPRAQAIGEAIRPDRGQLLVFPNSRRPLSGSRGWYAANVRHGVSTVHSGARHTLGIIFHEAE